MQFVLEVPYSPVWEQILGPDQLDSCPDMEGKLAIWGESYL